jgi:hypothetical protein
MSPNDYKERISDMRKADKANQADNKKRNVKNKEEQRE